MLACCLIWGRHEQPPQRFDTLYFPTATSICFGINAPAVLVRPFIALLLPLVRVPLPEWANELALDEIPFPACCGRTVVLRCEMACRLMARGLDGMKCDAHDYDLRGLDNRGCHSFLSWRRHVSSPGKVEQSIGKCDRSLFLRPVGIGPSYSLIQEAHRSPSEAVIWRIGLSLSPGDLHVVHRVCVNSTRTLHVLTSLQHHDWAAKVSVTGKPSK